MQQVYKPSIFDVAVQNVWMSCTTPVNVFNTEIEICTFRKVQFLKRSVWFENVIFLKSNEWHAGCIYYMYSAKCFYTVLYLFSIIVCLNFLYFSMENREKYPGIIPYTCIMKTCKIWKNKNKKHVEYKKTFISLWIFNDVIMIITRVYCLTVA